MDSIITDIELIDKYKKGDNKAIEIILDRYKWLVKSVARSLFLSGGDNEDLIQEGMLGLVKAVVSFNGKSPFKSYAYLCVKNNILSAIKVSNAKKNIPLNTYVSFTSFVDENIDDCNKPLSLNFNPEIDYINKESVEELNLSIKEILSEFEYNVLKKYLSGSSFSELTIEFNKNQKSIENALHRIRKKIYNRIYGK